MKKLNAFLAISVICGAILAPEALGGALAICAATALLFTVLHAQTPGLALSLPEPEVIAPTAQIQVIDEETKRYTIGKGVVVFTTIDGKTVSRYYRLI
jgi:hypothetical protein